MSRIDVKVEADSDLLTVLRTVHDNATSNRLRRMIDDGRGHISKERYAESPELQLNRGNKFRFSHGRRGMLQSANLEALLNYQQSSTRMNVYW